MSRVTKFAGQDPGPTARVSGFLAHLRLHGFELGVSETATGVAALTHLPDLTPDGVRRALKTVCCGRHEEVSQFDMLFDSYWLDAGRVREKIVQSPQSNNPAPEHSRTNQRDAAQQGGETGRPHAPDTADNDGDSHMGGTGKLMAAKARNLMKKDLRDLVDPEDIRAAEKIALQLGKALRDRRSRRRKAAKRGQSIDFRRTMRAALPSGGEPLRLHRRTRPERPLKIVALCDVSGSMMLYARPFLAFLAGLMRADTGSDAYLFHTRLVRIADALRDPDPLRALNRVTLLADGMGGGSRIGGNLAQFAQTYARKFVDGRSVVIILSDGYDSDPPEILAAALKRLRRRGCRIIWLNPLKGWAGYEPVARGMAAALPHLDLFQAANTLDTLAALEPELARL